MEGITIMWHNMKALYVHKLHNKVKKKPNRKNFSLEDHTDDSIGWVILKGTLALFVVVASLAALLLIPV